MLYEVTVNKGVPTSVDPLVYHTQSPVYRHFSRPYGPAFESDGNMSRASEKFAESYFPIPKGKPLLGPPTKVLQACHGLVPVGMS